MTPPPSPEPAPVTDTERAFRRAVLAVSASQRLNSDEIRSLFDAGMAAGLADRARAQEQIRELEARLKDTADSIWERHRHETTDDCEDGRCSSCDQVKEARALLGEEVPDVPDAG